MENKNVITEGGNLALFLNL